MRERWTLVVVRDGNEPVRQVSLTGRALALGGGSLLGATALLLILVTGLGFGGSGSPETHQLRSTNQTLAAELERLQAEVSGLEGTIDRLASRDTELRAMAGLEPIDDEVLEAGVGGPGLEGPESHRLFPLDSALGKQAFAVDYDLDALRRRARLLSESMEEAGDSLSMHRDLLRATPSIMPTSGYLSSRFSYSRIHPIYNEAMPHPGVDISAPRGTPIVAAADGRIVRAGWVAGYGNTVEIDHGFGYETLYGHASKLLVRAGQRVKRGDMVALVGSTGIATSSHLHYEVRVNGRAQNPTNYILPGIVP